MAELNLTDAEKAAVLWTDMDDESLGRLLRKKLVFLATASAQMDRTVSTAAALVLCCDVAEANATEARMDFDGVTQGGRDFGDWQIVVTKRVDATGG